MPVERRVHVEEPGLAKEIAKARFKAFLNILPYAVLANLAAVACVFWILHGAYDYRRGLLWLEAVAAASAAWLLVARGDSRGNVAPRRLAKLRHALLAGLMASLLGFAYFYTLPRLEGYDQQALIVAQVVFLLAGTSINNLVPAVATVWGSVLGASAFAAFVRIGGDRLGSTLAGYSIVFGYAALSSILLSKMYGQRFKYQIRAERGERELSMLFDQSPLSIVITDRKGSILRVNRKMEELSGYTVDELLGKNPRLLQSGETPPEVYEDLWATVTGGRVWTGEFANMDKGGSKYIERATISPILDSEGSISRYMAIKEDISVQRGYEQRLKRQSELIELLLRDFEEKASDWLWELDSELRLTYISEKIQKAWGLGPLIGVPMAELFGQALPPGDAEAARMLDEGLTALEGTRAFRDLRIKLRMPAGEEWFSFTAAPVFDAEGRKIGWRGSGRDITEKKSLEALLERRAHYDEMTGLPNRHMFRELIQSELESEGGLGSAMLGIMHLGKLDPIRAELGSSAYNKAVEAFVAEFRACMGAGPVLARLARDEFAFWLREPDAEALDGLFGLARGVNESFPVGGDLFSLDLHVGLAFYPEDSRDRNGIFRAADLALTGARSESGRRVMRYQAELATAFLRRLNLVKDFTKALAGGQFSLRYQAQVSAESGAVIGAEALLRWEHPAYGAVSPAEFIPLAEQSGFIVALGEWALAQACADAAGWPDDIGVSVNISGVQLRDSRSVVRAVRKALGAHPLPPGRLILEITESATYGSDDILESLADLRAMGVSIALDDFGTGYSSLSYIRRLGLDKLKIDQSFVRELGSGSGSETIVAIIMDLARMMGLGTVAEGVETGEQAEILYRLGCEAFQGYLYGKALRLEEFLDSLGRR